MAAAEWLPLQRALYVVANLFLLALAVAILWRRDALVMLQRAGAAMFAKALPAMRVLRAREGGAARFGLGMVWGLVPCALTYSVLPIAACSRAARSRAAPSCWLLDWARSRICSPRHGSSRGRGNGSVRRIVRYGAAALLAAFAGLGVWRAVYGPLSSMHGAFCF